MSQACKWECGTTNTIGTTSTIGGSGAFYNIINPSLRSAETLHLSSITPPRSYQPGLDLNEKSKLFGSVWRVVEAFMLSLWSGLAQVLA